MAHQRPPRIKKTRVTDSGISKYRMSIKCSPCLAGDLDQVPVLLINVGDSDLEPVWPFDPEGGFHDSCFCDHGKISLSKNRRACYVARLYASIYTEKIPRIRYLYTYIKVNATVTASILIPACFASHSASIQPPCANRVCPSDRIGRASCR